MTNYDRFLQHSVRDPQFAQSYYDARLERLVDDMLASLKEKIAHDEPKENVLKEIDAIRQHPHGAVEHASQSTSPTGVVVS